MDDNCHVEPIQKATTAEEQKNVALVLLAVWGMGCPNCANRVRNSLLALDGVFIVDIFLDMAMAEISYDSAKVSVEMLQDAVSRAGNDGRHHYRAELIAALYSSIQDEI